MKNYLKHIDDFFREKLGRYRETPPPDVWEALDKQLDGLVPSAPRPSLRWLGHLAMVSLVAVLSIPLIKKFISNTSPADSAVKTAAVATAIPQANVQAASTANVEKNRKGTNGESEQTELHPQNANATAANKPTAGDKTNPGKTGAQTGELNTGNDKHNTPAVVKTANHNATEGKKKRTSKQRTKAGNSTDDEQPLAHNSNMAKNPRTAHEKDSYGSSAGNDITGPGQNGTAAVNTPVQTKPKAEQKDDLKAKTAQKNKKEEKRIAPLYSRIELGLKAGYECGVNNNAASKYTVSPYLQYNLSPKVALMVQPAIKYARAGTHNIGNSQQYYRIIEGGDVKQNGSSSPNIIGIGGTTDTISYTTKYTYSSTYDSIRKSYTTGGAYLEMELPLLVKYNLSKKLSVYGGADLIYSKLTGVKENTYTKYGVTRSVDFSETTPALPVITPAGPGISYTGNPIASYNGPAYQAPAAGKLSIGYMLGVSYEFTHRWLFDALVEQGTVGRNVVGGYDINAPLSSVYFRLSAGYKFIK